VKTIPRDSVAVRLASVVLPLRTSSTFVVQIKRDFRKFRKMKRLFQRNARKVVSLIAVEY